MKTQMDSSTKTYSVPLDMLMNILHILFENGIPNRIKGINVKDSVIWLNVKFPVNHPYRKEIRSNIESLLSDYHYYLNGTDDEREFDCNDDENN